MLRLNRKTEYALMALEHMSKVETEAGEPTSTREVAKAYHIPYPLLAKVMQKLAASGLIKAVHGTKGGYLLAKRADDITVADVVEIFDGRVAVAECFKEAKITCPQWDGCLIKDPLAEFNRKIFELLARTTVKDLLGGTEGGGSSSEVKQKQLPVYTMPH